MSAFIGEKIRLATDDEIGGYETAFEALGSTYLEHSWVLHVSEDGLVASFVLDLVLTPEHHELSAALTRRAALLQASAAHSGQPQTN